ncbi:MAG: hypothetical protein QW040_01805 [Candidatus Aenigmatarchaeota archaeon]
MKKIVIASIVVILMLLLLYFQFKPFQKRIKISMLISSNETREVEIEGTIVKIGKYIFLEDGSWAIRIINGSNFKDNFPHLSLGDRVSLRGKYWKFDDKLPVINVSNVKLLSNNFPIQPVEVQRIDFPHRVIRIREQKLIGYKETEDKFWSLNFTDFKVIIPQSYVNVILEENKSYEIVGIVHFDNKTIWGISLS